MKKFFMVTFVLSLSLIIAACGGGETSSDDNTSSEDSGGEEIQLRVGSGVSEEHIWFQSFFNRWMERVETETDGQVTFEVHSGGSLVEMGEEYDALNSGLIDMAMPMYNLYDPERFPLSEVTMLPTLDSDIAVSTKAYADLIESDEVLESGATYYDSEFGDRGFKMWATPLTQPYNLSTTTGSIESTDDLTSLTVRSPARIADIFLNNLGSNSVSMASSDAYDALSRGAIDGTLLSISDWLSYGFHDVLDYTLEGANIGHFSGVFGMTQETWDNLPENVQEVMQQAYEEEITSEETFEVIYDIDEDARQQYEENGGAFENLEDQPQEVQDSVNEALVASWADWIELVEGNGEAGREIALMWRDLIIEHGGEVPEEIEELE